MLWARTLPCIILIGDSNYVTVLLESPFLSHAAGRALACSLQVTNARFKNVKSITGSDCEWPHPSPAYGVDYLQLHKDLALCCTQRTSAL